MKPIFPLLVFLLLAACTDQSKEAWARRLEVDEGLAAPAFIAKYGLEKFPHREGNVSGLMTIQVFFLPDCDLVLMGKSEPTGTGRIYRPLLVPSTTTADQRLKQWDDKVAALPPEPVPASN